MLVKCSWSHLFLCHYKGCSMPVKCNWSHLFLCHHRGCLMLVKCNWSYLFLCHHRGCLMLVKCNWSYLFLCHHRGCSMLVKCNWNYLFLYHHRGCSIPGYFIVIFTWWAPPEYTSEKKIKLHMQEWILHERSECGWNGSKMHLWLTWLLEFIVLDLAGINLALRMDIDLASSKSI
jgi:hypothetical protein